jgi:hypothetical protein
MPHIWQVMHKHHLDKRSGKMIGEMMSIYPLLNMITLYVNVLKENFLG